VRVQGEIDRIVTTMDSARAKADTYQSSLGGIAATLTPDSERVRVKEIIARLAESTRDMRLANAELHQRLTASRAQLSALQDDLQTVRAEALTDPLTQLANRKSLDGFVAETMASGVAFSFLLVDIDHFKSFNDRHGHLVGDQVLRVISDHLHRSLRDTDLAARYGGEEFAIVLPAMPLKEATLFADNIRSSVARRELVRRASNLSYGRVTISIGVACWQPGESATSLFERADGCLYLAKHRGRNQVVPEDELSPPEVETLAAM
jgi:diguanylate cyclase